MWAPEEVPAVNAVSDVKFLRGMMDNSIFQKAKPKKILVFMPYSGIWPMQLQTFQLLRNLPKAKYDVLTVSCGKALNRNCAVYESYGQPGQDRIKESLCDKCRKSSLLVTRKLESANLVLNDFVSDTEKERFSSLIAQLNAETLIDFEYEGYDIGRLTSYETLIKFKKIDLKLSPQEESYWKNGIYQGLTTLHAARKILAEHKPDLVLIYSPQYVAGSVFASTSKAFEVPVYFLEGSVHLAERYKAMHVWDWETHGLVDPAIEAFDLMDKIDFNANDIKRVLKHLKATEKSKSFGAYSVAKKKNFDIRTEFALKDKTKIVLCALSSHDEIYSGNVLGKIPNEKHAESLFTNQFEWIKYTIAFAAKNPEIHFIIRVHPRLWKNKREQIIAGEYSQWQMILERLPSNVTADFPEDKRSIANYYDSINLLITGWSSTALDAMVKGVPTLTYVQTISWFPYKLVTRAKSLSDYDYQVKRKINENVKEQMNAKALSWLSLRLIKGTVKVPGRIIDQLKLNNILFFEKLYNFGVRYVFNLVSQLDTNILSRSDKSFDHRFESLLEARETSLFESNNSKSKRDID